MIATLDAAWAKHFARTPGPMTSFLQSLLPGDRQEQVLEPLTAEILQETLRRARADSSPGVDQWRYSDLKALPFAALQELTLLLNEIEKQRKWPSAVSAVWIGVIVDAEPLPALKHRPISLLPTIVWLWGSARLRTLTPWLDRVLAESTFAYRRHYSAEKASILLQPKMEQAAYDSSPMFVGASPDMSKAFPSTSRTVLASMWKGYGEPKSIVETLMAYYDSAPARWRIMGRAVSGCEFFVRNVIWIWTLRRR